MEARKNEKVDKYWSVEQLSLNARMNNKYDQNKENDNLIFSGCIQNNYKLKISNQKGFITLA